MAGYYSWSSSSQDTFEITDPNPVLDKNFSIFLLFFFSSKQRIQIDKVNILKFGGQSTVFSGKIFFTIFELTWIKKELTRFIVKLVWILSKEPIGPTTLCTANQAIQSGSWTWFLSTTSVQRRGRWKEVKGGGGREMGGCWVTSSSTVILKWLANHVTWLHCLSLTCMPTAYSYSIASKP